MSIITQYSPWFIILCITAGFLFTFFLYRKDKKLQGVSKSVKYIMYALRFASVSLIAMLLLGLFIKSISKNIKKPIIIFAQDNSESVINSTDTLYKIECEKFLNKLSDKYEVKTYSFGEELKKGLNFSFKDKETDIAQTLSEVNSIYFNDNVGALILASDGIYNKGNNPIYKAEKMRFPVYTVALGDTTVKKDLAILNVKHNEIVFLNNNFTVETTITASKLRGKDSEISIYSKKKLLYKEKIQINSDNFFKKIIFEINADKSGIVPLNIVLKAVSGEKNIKNNRKQIVVEVTDLKQKILILANSPHPDISALKNSLEVNQNLDVDFYYAKDFKKNIKEYNLVILHQLPSKKNDATQLTSKILSLRIPVIYILGRESNLSKFNNLRTGLKIDRGSGTFDDINGYINKKFDLFKVNENIADLVEQAPPLISPFGNYKLTGKSEILLYTKIKSLETRRPLLIFNTSGINLNTKTAVITGEGLWRWRMFDYKKNNNHYTFDELINKTVQYLTLKELKERFVVKAPKIINENRNIVFDAEVYNKSFELVNEQDVNMIVKDSLNNQLDFVFDKTAKAYTLNAGDFNPGEYSWKAETLIDGKVRSKSSIFRVIAVNLEEQNTIANHNLLYQISLKTNGKMFSNNQFNELFNNLIENKNIVPISYIDKKLENILNWKWLLIFIIFLMSTEWLLRKLYGLI